MLAHSFVHDEMARLEVFPVPVRERVVRFPFVQATKRFVADAVVANNAAFKRALGREVMMMVVGK